MKNSTALRSYSPCKGVYLYFDNTNFITCTCVDIDIDPDVEDLVLSGPNPEQSRFSIKVMLRNINKQFKNVKSIFIGYDIADIDISNLMFPNVRKIESDNPRYRDNTQYLINDSGFRSYLQNVFCIKKQEEPVQTVDVSGIRDYAFEGCEATDGFFNDSEKYVAIRIIEEKAFYNSGFLKCKPKNGVRLQNYIITDIDENADTIILHKKSNDYAAPIKLDFKNVKRLVIDDVKSIQYLYNMPEIVSIKSDCNNLLLGPSYMTSLSIKAFEAPASSLKFKAIDGILYSKDGTTLIKCPRGKTGAVVIPEGVMHIQDYAFYESQISSIKFPNSLKYIGKESFAYSKIEHVDFGTGIQNLGGYDSYSFSKCDNLTRIEIPPQIKKISSGFFFNCVNLKEVIFHEGLEYIGKQAFGACWKLKEISLPPTVTFVGDKCFSHTEILRVEKPFTDMLRSLTSAYPSSLISHTKELFVNGKCFYVPGCMRQRALQDFAHATDFPDNLYEYAATAELKQDTALYMYNQEDLKDTDVELYLRRCAKKISERLMTDKKEEEFANFVSLGLLSKSSLKQLLEKARNYEDMSYSAYLLSAMNDNNKNNNSFKL